MSKVVLAITLFSCIVSANSGSNCTDQVTFDQITPTRELIWHPCYTDYVCAKLDVPLDYSNPQGTRAAVPIIKIPAQLNGTNEKYQGLLFTNPGGPGNSGIDFILTMGYSTIIPVIPKTYDLVSWDPRGMGYSTPYADCQIPTTRRKSKRAYGITGPDISSALYEDQFQTAILYGAQCSVLIGGPNDAGPHMSTPAVARDALSIVDAFAKTKEAKTVANPTDFNYWGFSYGTVIGQTFASLFPDRVGRFALDGVIDAEDFYSAQFYSVSRYDDAVMDLFFDYCFVAGPSLCSYYTGSSANDLKIRFLNLFAQFDVKTAYAENWDNATTIDQSLGLVFANIRSIVYSPITGFPQLAEVLTAYEVAVNNLTIDGIVAAGQAGAPPSDTPPGYTPELAEWPLAVACSDTANVLYNQTLKNFTYSNARFANESYTGHVGWSFFKILCTGWSINATWVFNGTLGAATKNPILFVSNTVDPAAPIEK
ncbi:hypothetical protein BJ878DRAFT_416094 [Calycina marina]|uniref:AB hydrolase-1 domain-containing protein n=1 Tax=Calycina marina TaxID=1763456 RepID=A0A9P8CH35_9HELO|nr:hypothetical protein BJ878DRAFT_416094 [Calycina marina]